MFLRNQFTEQVLQQSVTLHLNNMWYMVDNKVTFSQDEGVYWYLNTSESYHQLLKGLRKSD